MALEKAFPVYAKKHASGNTGYRVDMGVVAGKRTFKSFPSREAAERFQRRCREAEARKKPADLRDLDEITRHEVLAALARLKEHDSTITQAVDFYLRHAKPAGTHATIDEVMKAFRAAKLRAGLTSKYLRTSEESFFRPFRDHFKDCQISDVTREQAETYLYRSKSWSVNTRRAHIRHLGVLFNFAVSNGYLGYNPLREVTKPKKPAGTSKQRVVTVDNVHKLLRYALDHGYKDECTALVLILFCGVRVEEVTRLSWADIRMDEKKPVVVLADSATKTGKARINPIPGNAMDWLKLLRKEGKVTGPAYLGRMRYLRKKAKAGFLQNSARICFASYHVARFEDAPKTAFLLGHDNPTLLYSTYRALVSKEEAERYWKITPDFIDGNPVFDSLPDEKEVLKSRMDRIADVLTADGG